MRKGIKLTGNADTVLSVKLSDILNCLDNGDRYKWAIFWVSGTGNLIGKSMLDFEDEINNSSSGYFLDWIDLKSLSTSFDQLIDLVLIGDNRKENISKNRSDEEIRYSNNIFIELIDSTYWMVHSDNMIFIECLINTVPGAEIIE